MYLVFGGGDWKEKPLKTTGLSRRTKEDVVGCLMWFVLGVSFVSIVFVLRELLRMDGIGPWLIGAGFVGGIVVVCIFVYIGM